MITEIGTYIKTPLLKTWSNEFISKLDGFVSCQHFPTLTMLGSNLKNQDKKKSSNYYIIIDIEDELHVEYIYQLKKIALYSKFIAFGLPKDAETIKNVFKQGYNGYIDISITTAEFINAINILKSNQYYMPSDKLDELITLIINEGQKKNEIEHLNGSILKEKLSQFKISVKELEVIEYLLKGFSFKQISQIIGITSFAVNQRTKSIYKKCNVKTRSELSYLLLR